MGGSGASTTVLPPGDRGAIAAAAAAAMSSVSDRSDGTLSGRPLSDWAADWSVRAVAPSGDNAVMTAESAESGAPLSDWSDSSGTSSGAPFMSCDIEKEPSAFDADPVDGFLADPVDAFLVGRPLTFGAVVAAASVGTTCVIHDLKLVKLLAYQLEALEMPDPES